MNPHLLCFGGNDHDLRIAFLRSLGNKGFRVIAAGTGEAAPFTQAGIDYYPFHFNRFINPLADWAAMASIKNLVAKTKPQLIQCFDTKLNFLVPLALGQAESIPLIRTINGLGWVYSSRSPLALGLRPLYRTLSRMASRSAAMTVFQNRDDQGFFQRNAMVVKDSSRLIPGSGIDIQGFEQIVANGRSPREIREELGLGAGEVVITVTRLTRQKGIPTLLEAAALVHAERPSVRFLLVGPRQSEGPLAMRSDEIARHAPYVQAIGRRTDIPSLLGIADVFTFPTQYREGVPRVLLEAALACLPIVATDMPGCRDVIQNGWNGYLVPPRDSRLLADRILDLLRNRDIARAMGVRASTRVRQEFNLDTIVSQYAALYTEILESRSEAQAIAKFNTRDMIYPPQWDPEALS